MSAFMRLRLWLLPLSAPLTLSTIFLVLSHCGGITKDHITMNACSLLFVCGVPIPSVTSHKCNNSGAHTPREGMGRVITIMSFSVFNHCFSRRNRVHTGTEDTSSMKHPARVKHPAAVKDLTRVKDLARVKDPARPGPAEDREHAGEHGLGGSE